MYYILYVFPYANKVNNLRAEMPKFTIASYNENLFPEWNKN